MIAEKNRPRLVLIFNHRLTESQKIDAHDSLGVGPIVELPEELQEIWSNIPASVPEISAHLEPLRQWLRANASVGDYVLTQGDFGATYLMVRFAHDMGLVPLYSTTRREVTEEILPDGSVQSAHRFAHVRFRRYEV